MSEKRLRWTPRVIEGGKAEGLPAPKPAGSDINAWPRSMLFKDANYAIKNLDVIRRANERADEIASFIMSLRGYAQDPNDVVMRREGLLLTPLEKMIEYLTESGEADWRVHPAFYTAVIVEYADRTNCIRDTIMELPGA